MKPPRGRWSSGDTGKVGTMQFCHLVLVFFSQRWIEITDKYQNFLCISLLSPINAHNFIEKCLDRFTLISTMRSNLVTFISRLRDSMIMVQSMEASAEVEGRAKRILREMKSTSPAKCTINESSCFYHYIMDREVVYLTIAERDYPKELAFQFLTEVSEQFQKWHGRDVSRYDRPYAAVEFDSTMSEIRRQYIDPQSPANLEKVNRDLHQIRNIMQQNISDVLGRGAKLEDLTMKSDRLKYESKAFSSQAKWFNTMTKIKAMAPWVATVVFVLMILWWRFR
eukprot:g34424.t1